MLLPETCDPNTVPSFDNGAPVSATATNDEVITLTCADTFETNDADVTCTCDTTGNNNAFTCSASSGPTCSPSKHKSIALHSVLLNRETKQQDRSANHSSWLHNRKLQKPVHQRCFLKRKLMARNRSNGS